MAMSSFCRSRVLPVVLFCFFVTGTLAEILPSISWNPENPIFGNLGNSARKVMPFDKLSIICPNLFEYPVKRDDFYSKDQLYENVYMVDKRGYDNCNATAGFKILLCDNPTEHKHTTIVFQQMSASADDPEFDQGKEYYFINTASGSSNSLKNMEGGRCNEGMKMKIYVCAGNSDEKCPKGNEVIHGGWSVWSKCEGGHQTRICNNFSPENGGVGCVSENERPCSTTASQTVGCQGSSCPTPTVKESTVKPGSPSKDNRTGDTPPPFSGFQISKGLFLGICVIVLLVGIISGFGLAALVCRKRMSSRGANITDAALQQRPASMYSRPDSIFSTVSTASESAKMVPEPRKVDL